MTYLENRPEHFMPLLALVRRVLGVFHFIAEFEEGILDIVEARRGRFLVARCSYGWHFALFPNILGFFK
jgi:hypothetical protein